MTTREDIARWFKAGVEKGATHMIVVCDTFDWEDYPVYVTPGEDVHKAAQKYSNESRMSRVMEVYALHMDMDEQLAERRAFHYDAPPADASTDRGTQ